MNKRILTVSGIILGLIIVVSLFNFNIVNENEIEPNKKARNVIEKKDDKVIKKEPKELEQKPVVIEEEEELNIINILVIGVDGESFENKRSDVMIIASIDVDNKTIKLTSVMRDTLAHIPTSNTYQKLNHSYMEGGPEETMRAFNVNFGLQIENYVVFDYNAIKKVVDFVGGYPANVTSGEAKDMGITPGFHTLHGDYAVDYMRVRKNSGGDTGRNQRQRDLMIYVMNEAKNMSKTSLLGFALQLFPEIETSYSVFDVRELIDLYGVVKDGLDFEQYSFPFEYRGKILSDRLWYAVPRTMETNVERLHQKIYEKDYHIVDDKIKSISEVIKSISGID